VIPNPCALSPVALVATALGVPRTSVHAVAQSSKVDGLSIKTCVFSHGSVHVTTTVAPAAFGTGSGGLPGLVTSHPSGLGPNGALLSDSRPGISFASAHFVEKGLWAEAYSNAHVAPGTVLALGRYMFAHLP